MEYAMLLWPYANSRYAQAVRPLFIAELKLLLLSAGLETEIEYRQTAGCDWLHFCIPEENTRALELARLHSHAQFIARIVDDHMDALVGRTPCAVGDGLSSVLKYKGKTSELFTRAMLNMAACASRFEPDARLCFMDPMCGRGTALFEALNRGWDVVGSDIAASDLEQGYQYLKRYLEMGRIKHEQRADSLTLPGGRSLRRRELRMDSAVGRLSAAFIVGTADAAANALRAKSFHLMAADLPYGVQHAPDGKNSFEEMLSSTLPALRSRIKSGGALALSFNTYTLKAHRVCMLMEQAGMKPLRGSLYEGLEHWIEQAVSRDLVVARVP